METRFQDLSVQEIANFFFKLQHSETQHKPAPDIPQLLKEPDNQRRFFFEIKLLFFRCFDPKNTFSVVVKNK